MGEFFDFGGWWVQLNLECSENFSEFTYTQYINQLHYHIRIITHLLVTH